MVLDSNVWISGFLVPGRQPSRLALALIQGQHQGLISPYILSEIERALSSLRLSQRYQIRREEIIQFLLTLQTRLEIVEPMPFTYPARDPNDLPIVGTALAGRASYLVTGDRDLLDDANLKEWARKQGLQIISPADLELD